MRILKKLGNPRRGNLYLVESGAEKRVLKELPELEEQLKTELKEKLSVISKFCHENLLHYYGWEQIEDKEGILAEYISGASLKQSREKSEQEVLSVLLQLCDGLRYIHDKGYLHCDIKPSNVLIGAGGRVKLADFEYLRKAGDNIWEKTGGYTPGYASKELVEGKELSPASDIYSLGIMLGKLLGGTDHLLPDKNAIYSELCKLGINGSLRKIYLNMTAESAPDRYQSIQEVERELWEYCQQQRYEYRYNKPEVAEEVGIRIKPSGFVGRESELRKVNSALDSRHQVVVIRGEQGIGKSSLMQELIRRQLEQKQAVIKFDCRSNQAGYFPFYQIIKSILDKEKITDLEAAYGGNLPGILSVVLPEIRQERKTANRQSSKLKLADLFLALQELISHISKDRFILYLDDLHKGSSELLHWVKFLIKMQCDKGFDLVLLYRSEEIDESFDQEIETFYQEGNIELVDIYPLGRSLTDEMVRKMLPGSILGDAMQNLLYKRSGGNPLFLRNLVYYLRENQQLENFLAGSDSGEIELPMELRELIISKRQQLRSMGIYLLELLAVLNRSMNLKRLKRYSGIDEERLNYELKELCRVLYLRVINDQYEFTHASNQEVIYETMPDSRRQDYHIQIVTKLEAEEKGDYESIRELAYHAYCGKEEAKTIYYNEKAFNQHQREGGFYSDKIDYCKRLIELFRNINKPCEELSWAFQLMNIYIFNGNRKKLEKLIDETLSRVDLCSDIQRRAQYWLQLTNYYISCKELTLAREYLEKVEEFYQEDREDLPGFAEYAHVKVNILSNSGEIERAFTLNKKGIEAAEREQNSEEIRRGLNTRGTLYHMSGNFAKAQEYYEQFVKLAVESQNLIDLYNGNYNLIILHMRSGQYEKAEELLEQNREFTQQTGLKMYQASNYMQIGQLHYFKGENSQAISMNEKALEIYRQSGNKSLMGRLYTDMGTIYLRFDHSKAIEMFNLAKQLASEIDDINLDFLCSANLGMIAKRNKDYQQALVQFEDALQIAETHKLYQNLDRLYIDIGDILIITNRLEKGRSFIEKGLTIAQSNKRPLSILLAKEKLSVYEKAKGNYQQAIEYLDEILAMQISAKPQEVGIRYDKWHLMKLNGVEEKKIKSFEKEIIELIESIEEKFKSPDLQEILNELRGE